MLNALLFLLAIIDIGLVWNWYRLRKHMLNARNRQQRLQAELHVDRLRLAESQFRTDVMQAAIQHESPLDILSRQQTIPVLQKSSRTPFILRIRLSPASVELTEVAGLSNDAANGMRFNAARLWEWHSPTISREELSTGDLVRLPPHLLVDLPLLHVWRAEPADRGASATMLLLSDLPAITGHADRDRKLLGLLDCVWDTLGAPAPSPGTDLEIKLVKDMLDLRVLTDVEFQSPLDLLTEFLGKLSQASDFDRAALYLKEQPPANVPEPFAQAGRPLERSLMPAWLAAEQQLLLQHADRREPVLLCPESVQALAAPFHSGMILPLFQHSEMFGRLVLTGRQMTLPGDTEQHLARWSAEYLATTIIRTADRAAIEDQARRDPLTQLANRHAFDEVLRRCVRTAQSSPAEPVALILFDLDHFKSVNDRYGHLAGDAVLKHAAALIQSVSHSRVTDLPLVARYGGEEIAVLLPSVGTSGALRIAEAIRHALATTPVTYDGECIEVTASGGIAVCPFQANSSQALIAAADAALYQAKRSGRNRVCEAAPVSVLSEAP